MNETPDGLNSHTPDLATPDPALEDELRAYFASKQSAPPDSDVFWLRLNTRLETHAAPTLAPERPTPSHLDERHLDHLDGDEASLATGAGGSGNGNRPRRGRRMLSTLGSLAAVALICLGAVAIFSQFGHGTSTGRNNKIVQSRLLTWRQVTLPPDVVLQEGQGVVATRDGGTPVTSLTTLQPNSTYVVASNNGAVAYICETPAHATPRIWMTENAGQRWTRLPDLPTSTTDFTGCGMQTDKNDARTLVLSFANPASDNAGVGAGNMWVFFDGASQWQPMSQPILEFAASHGVYFATRNLPYQNAFQTHLFISTDQMRSWREIDTPLIAENVAAVKRLKQTGVTGVEHIWAHPATGELLAQTYDGLLWLSGDSGATWKQVALPQATSPAEWTPTPGQTVNETSQAGAAWVYVQQPVANAAFTLCALVFDQSQNIIILNNAPLYCSSNSGKRWLQMPRLTVAVGNGKPDQFELPLAMLSNGALLAWDVRTISMMAGFEPELLSGHILGAIPTPLDPENIPGGEFGVTIEGAVFWQPQDSQTLYVAVYTYSSDPALGA